MAFNVRIFGHRGIQQMPLVLPQQYTSESVFQLVQPYEFHQTLSVSNAAARSSPQAQPDATMVLRVEVPDGQSVRYEICPPNRVVDAGADSPILSGHDQFYFRQGWTVSLIDAAGLP